MPLILVMTTLVKRLVYLGSWVGPLSSVDVGLVIGELVLGVLPLVGGVRMVVLGWHAGPGGIVMNYNI